MNNKSNQCKRKSEFKLPQNIDLVSYTTRDGGII